MKLFLRFNNADHKNNPSFILKSHFNKTLITLTGYNCKEKEQLRFCNDFDFCLPRRITQSMLSQPIPKIKNGTLFSNK